MLKSQAISAIQQLKFVCPNCHSLSPYRNILISPTPLQQRTESASTNESDTCPQEHSSTNNRQQQTQSDTWNTIKLCDSLCLPCYISVGGHSSKMHPLKDLLEEYVMSLPLPNIEAAELCLQLMGEIQEKSKSIINSIYQKLDQVKFYMLDLGRQIKNTCNKYIEQIKYHSQLQIQDFIKSWQLSHKCKKVNRKSHIAQFERLNKSQATKLKNMFSLNQSSTLQTLSSYHSHLSSLLQNLPHLSLSVPALVPLQSAPAVRSRTKLSQIPISTMCIFKNTPYYGLSDGRILVSRQLQTVAHKAHQSLIRSFANDGQNVLYSGSDDFTIKAWNTQVKGNGFQCLGVFGVLGEANKSYHRGICVLHDQWGIGNLMVSTRGQYDSFKIRIWDLNSKYQNVGVLDGHDSFIRAIAIIDKQKNIIMTGSDDKTLKTWDPRTQTLLKTVPRHRKPLNIIPSPNKISMLCIIEQENRFALLDKHELCPIVSVTLPRRILCSCGYNSLPKSQTSYNNRSNGCKNGTDTTDGYQYFVVCVPGNIGIYGWDGAKVWAIDVEVTYAPIACMQFGSKIMLIDGSGVVEIVYVGHIQTQQIQQSDQSEKSEQEQLREQQQVQEQEQEQMKKLELQVRQNTNYRQQNNNQQQKIESNEINKLDQQKKQ